MRVSVRHGMAVTLLGLGLAAPATAEPRQDQGRQTQQGEASFYGREFNGRRMANGERFDPGSDSAAHRTLPLGTTARVTNLRNGRTATVKVSDRGPYARNRVIDVSPSTADHLDMKQGGVAPVRVTPIEVPDRDQRPGQQQAGRR